MKKKRGKGEKLKLNLDYLDFEEIINDDDDIEKEQASKTTNEEIEDEEYSEYDFVETTTMFNTGNLSPLTEEEKKLLSNHSLLKENSFDSVFLAPDTDSTKEVRDEDIFLKDTEQGDIEARNERVEKVIIEIHEWTKGLINEGVNNLKRLSSDKERVRTYNKKAVMPKITYAKAFEQKSPLPKIIMFLLACCGVGGFLGYMANSYYVFKGGEVESAMSCAFLWIMVENMPLTLSPFHANVFGLAFIIGFSILAVIGIFIYLDNDAKKHSRVGYEHGKKGLGKPSDFKSYKRKFMECMKKQDSTKYDNNMIFGVYRGEYLGLSLNNKKVNRSANVLVIGGTGTGKTFKYIKPNILQENCSMIVTDPSGDIFRSFAPYLLSKGYNVYLFNASDFTLSNHYNPLLNVYDTDGEISETQVDILVDLYMKNAKAGKEASGGDPFWDKSQKAFMTALIYYVLEEDEKLLKEGFTVVEKDSKGEITKQVKVNAMEGGKCFSTILKLVQEAKVDDDNDEKNPLTLRLENFFERKPNNKTKLYYDTFQIAPQKTANTILITTAVDLQIFSTKSVDMITRENEKYRELNIDIDKIATQQSYLFLGIPQSHQAYNFLIAMLYSQLYGRLYELGERKLRGKWHIGYRVGTPVFDYFDSKEEAIAFYETVTKEDIVEDDYVHKKIYNLQFRTESEGVKSFKTCVLKEPLEKLIDDMEKMVIWSGDEFAGGDPALPIHINFLLDEFKNIGEIPNFLTILSTSRKYRIGSHVVIQDIGQIKTMYKDGEHETLLANVDTTIFLGSILKEDKEEIQKMLGTTTIRQKSTSSSGSGLSTSYTPTEVKVMSIDEIEDINNPQKNRDDAIVIVRDVTPFVCRKLNLTEHARWKDVKAVKDIDAFAYYKNNPINSETINK